MTERLRSPSTTGYPSHPKVESDLSPRKTLLVLVVVVGCFAVLWPKVFYPMLVGSANQHIKPSPIDKTTGCCDVISEIDVNTIKIMSELCGTIIKSSDGQPLNGKDIVQKCRQEILDTCGIDISAVLQEKVRLGQNDVKQILDEIRSLNGSLCLKYNFGVAPWRLGVPHRVTLKITENNIRQERPQHLRSELIHPAFRERGRAIPQPQPASPARPQPRVLEGRPGPIPGMRPTIGGAGHVVPPSKQGTSSMSVIMPIYTIGIVIFFTYTLMKIIFKKQPEGVGGALYPPIEPDPHFRKEVFESSERSRLSARLTRDSITNKLGDAELDQLRRRLRETEMAMERIVEQMAKVPLKSQDLINATLSNGDARKHQDADDQPTVKVLGMEMTASCEGGKKWSRPDSPVLPTSPPPPVEPVPPPQEIYLEGALPAQSHLLVSNSATEPQPTVGEDPAVVLAGKMTLSVISLDSSENGIEEKVDTNLLEEEKATVVEHLNRLQSEQDDGSQIILIESKSFVPEETESNDEYVIEQIKENVEKQQGSSLSDPTNSQPPVQVEEQSLILDDTNNLIGQIIGATLEQIESNDFQIQLPEKEIEAIALSAQEKSNLSNSGDLVNQGEENTDAINPPKETFIDEVGIATQSITTELNSQNEESANLPSLPKYETSNDLSKSVEEIDTASQIIEEFINQGDVDIAAVVLPAEEISSNLSKSIENINIAKEINDLLNQFDENVNINQRKADDLSKSQEDKNDTSCRQTKVTFEEKIDEDEEDEEIEEIPIEDLEKQVDDVIQEAVVNVEQLQSEKLAEVQGHDDSTSDIAKDVEVIDEKQSSASISDITSTLVAEEQNKIEIEQKEEDISNDVLSDEVEIGSEEEVEEVEDVEYDEEEDEEEEEEEEDEEEDDDNTDLNRTETVVPTVNGDASDGTIEESKHTSLSTSATAAENDISEEEITDDEEEVIEIEEEIDEDEEEIDEESNKVNHISGESESEH